MSSHFVLSWGSCWLRPGCEAGPGSPGGSAPPSAPPGGVVLSGVAKMGVAVVDLSRDGLQREHLPDPGVMWWPRSESPSRAVEAERPGLPISVNERRTASCLRSAQALLGRPPSGVAVAQTRTVAEEVCGSPATNSEVEIRHRPSSFPSAARPSQQSWSDPMVALRFRVFRHDCQRLFARATRSPAGGRRLDRGGRHGP
jgi:hypothetical protein